MNRKGEPWDLINWVKKQKLLVVEAIKYNNCSCLEIDDLWHALHSMFNMAQDHQVNTDILDEIPDKYSTSWPSFSREEFTSSIAKYNNSSTPGPDKLLWSYLKTIIKDNSCLDKIMSITDTCFELEF